MRCHRLSVVRNVVRSTMIHLQKESQRASLSNFSSTNLTLETDPATRISTLSLKRYEGKNAFSKAMLDDFKSVVFDLMSAEKTPQRIDCLVVKSDVEIVFCAGADLKERLKMAEEDVGPFVSSFREALNDFSRLPFPIIAAMEGVALGGGLELALACDLRIAGGSAKMGLPETNLAIIPGAGGTQRLPRIVGVAKAKEMIFTAKVLSSTEALNVGLVTELVPTGQAYTRAMDIAKAITTTKGPKSIRMAKAAIDNGMDVSINEGLLVEKACYAQVISTADRREGLQAFVEKRPPVYRGM